MAPTAAGAAARFGNGSADRYVDHANGNCHRIFDDLVSLVRSGQGALERPWDRIRDVNIDEEPNFRQKLVDLTGGYTVPQIVIGEQPIGGFTQLRALDASGGLSELLTA